MLENVVFLLCSSRVYVQFSHSLFSSYPHVLSEDEPKCDSVESVFLHPGTFAQERELKTSCHLVDNAYFQ